MKTTLILLLAGSIGIAASAVAGPALDAAPAHFAAIGGQRGR